jgi:3-hydroxyisobutyrate dehydrogenase-like beta-hydroxyacid dehydrogenase
VGFGEAGFCFAKGLSGLARLFAYDVHAQSPKVGEQIRQRATETGTMLVESPAELARACETILSVVTANSAIEAARENAPWLKSCHVYVDMNSVSPQTKREIGKIIDLSPARFVEAAIMAAVPMKAHKTPILLNGPGAAALIERLAPVGMQLEAMSQSASAVKMFRSIVIKGMEALIFEMRAGREQVWGGGARFRFTRRKFPRTSLSLARGLYDRPRGSTRRASCAGDGRGGSDPPSCRC